jgi:hypothetical protein
MRNLLFLWCNDAFSCMGCRMRGRLWSYKSSLDDGCGLFYILLGGIEEIEEIWQYKGV